VTSTFPGDDPPPGMTLEREFLQSESLARQTGAGVLLAVSGGADSVVMLRCFVAYTLHHHAVPATIHIAHVNHGLRGSESDDDALFVRQLAARFGLPYHETRLTPDMFAADDSGSVEAAARKLRYDFLQQTAEQNALRYVAVAHNADDQAETILQRIVRGTGIAGLAGIPPVRRLGEAVTLIRPMLPFSRQRILAYLNVLQQPFRTDSTNAKSKYTRNKIRNDLLPLLASEYNRAVGDALLRLATQAADWTDYVNSQTDALYDRAVICRCRQGTETGRCQTVTVHVGALSGSAPLLVRELFVAIWSRHHWHLRDMTFAHWQQLAEMTLPQTPTQRPTACKRIFPGAVVAERIREQLVLSPADIRCDLRGYRQGCISR